VKRMNNSTQNAGGSQLAMAGGVSQASRDGILPAGSESSRPVDTGDVPQDASEPEESRLQSSVGVSLPTPAKQEPDIKSESSS
jgi:hypothetical protein